MGVCSVQMQRLVQACQPGDSLVFQFSGHGSQMRDYSGDELDGLNETLLPCDFRAVRACMPKRLTLHDSAICPWQGCSS